MTTYNPWNVDSIQDFSFLKCPECPFDAKQEDIFQNCFSNLVRSMGKKIIFSNFSDHQVQFDETKSDQVCFNKPNFGKYFY